VLLPADITPPAVAILSWLLFHGSLAAPRSHQRVRSGRPPARERPASKLPPDGLRTGTRRDRRVGQCSADIPASTGLCAPRPSVSTFRTSSVVTTGREHAACLIGNAGNLHEILEATSSRSCAVACRLPEARRLRRRHVWRGTSLAGKCSLPYISRVSMIRWRLGFSELCPQRSTAPLQSHRSA